MSIIKSHEAGSKTLSNLNRPRTTSMQRPEEAGPVFGQTGHAKLCDVWKKRSRVPPPSPAFTILRSIHPVGSETNQFFPSVTISKMVFEDSNSGGWFIP
ncbi:hypothetical protein QLX08_002744 [Tetragonisca angustula]|uniref:Uncharacterized protein n=1 Tax=Tetragonisca angustula TaxID=166442 RepID=A0AAW1A9T2_9HYME